MRPRTVAIAAVGVLAYLVFLAAMTPASVVAERFRVEGVELDAVRGTLWKGSASARVRLAQGSLALDSVEWRFLPARLAAGRLAFDLKAAGAGFEGRSRIERGLSGIEIRDLQARAQAGAVAAFAPLAAPWQPQGTITLDAPSLVFDGRELRGEGRAEWRGAALSLSDVRPLGAYRAQLTAPGGPAKITLTTIEGPLRLSGDATLTPPSQFAFSGEARGEGAAAAQLEPLLNLLGPRRADGARELRWSQR
jgi:general secretion pathway protein N